MLPPPQLLRHWLELDLNLQILNKCDDLNAIAADENMLHILIYNKLITSHCSFISKAVEGTATQMAGTVAFNSNNLDLIDCYSIAGPWCEGYYLSKDDSGYWCRFRRQECTLSAVPAFCQCNIIWVVLNRLLWVRLCNIPENSFDFMSSYVNTR